MAVIEFLNTETKIALEQFSPYYHTPQIKTEIQRLPKLAPKVSYQLWSPKIREVEKAAFTVITRE